MTAVWGILRRVPWPVWIALGLVCYVAYLHHRLSVAERSAADAADAAKASAIKTLKDAEKVFDSKVRAVENRLAGIARESAAAAARTRQIEQGLTQARTEGQRLETSGSLDDVVAFGRSIGYHPVPARRP